MLFRSNHWDLKGSLKDESKHELKLLGQGKISPHPEGQILIEAENFTALNTEEYTMSISPKILITSAEDILNITGTILIPKARFKPIIFSHTIHLTDDAVFVSHEVKKSSPLIPMNTDILLKIGDDVSFDAEGLHGMLGGQIQLKKTAEGSMNAIGSVTIREGTYKAYGQDLNINHGEFLFSGGTLSNPKVNLRAARTFNNTTDLSGSNQLFDFNASNIETIDFGNHLTVGVQVNGNLNSPKITLYSVPASLSQADILSMLILGKPASQASQSGGQLLLTAVSAMKLDSGAKGTQLMSQLKQTGLDFDIQNKSLNKTSGDNTTLMVGKSISKRLYLSYNIGLFQENSNVLTLKYLLNKYFSVQVTTNAIGNGIDVLYTGHTNK